MNVDDDIEHPEWEIIDEGASLYLESAALANLKFAGIEYFLVL